MAEMSRQMDKFRDNLEQLAVSHKKDIQRDPEALPSKIAHALMETV